MAVKETAGKKAPPAKQGGMTLNQRRTLEGLSFITPNFIGFFVLILIPVLFTFWLCFNKWDGYTPMEFVALDNFKYIFTHKIFQEAVVKTLIFTACSVVITLLLALGLAVLINQKLAGIGIFRTAIFFPYVASVVAVAAVWQMLFQKDMGLINEMLRFFGVTDVPGWFATTKWPLLGNATFFVVMMLTINSFKSFDLIYALTEGGPGTATTLLSQYIYNQSFVSWDYGRASAAAMVLFAIVAVITLIQFRLEKKFSNE